MLTKALLFTIVAACGVTSNAQPLDASDPPEFVPPPELPQEKEGQHFCCFATTKANGEGCGAISGSDESINTCANVLYCPGEWVKTEGDVTCVK
jgi:hypothetical protein